MLSLCISIIYLSQEVPLAKDSDKLFYIRDDYFTLSSPDHGILHISSLLFFCIILPRVFHLKVVKKKEVVCAFTSSYERQTESL